MAIDGQLRRSEMVKKTLLNMSAANNDNVELSAQDGMNLGIRLSVKVETAERAPARDDRRGIEPCVFLWSMAWCALCSGQRQMWLYWWA